MTEAQFAALFGVLCQIRDLLAMGVQAAEEEADSNECQHPDDARVPFGPNEWICKLCKHEQLRKN